MGTRIDTEYWHAVKNISSKENLDLFKKKYYFREDSNEALKELVKIYKVSKFRNIETDFFPGEPFSKEGNVFALYGFNISDSEIEGAEFTKSIFDFNLDYLKHNGSLDKEGLIRSFILKYLIKREVKEKGYSSRNLNKTIAIKNGKYKYLNYLDERKNKEIKEKENQLEDILIYGKVLFGERFGLKEIDGFVRREIKILPKEFEPAPSSFFTLDDGKNPFLPSEDDDLIG